MTRWRSFKNMWRSFARNKRREGALKCEFSAKERRMA
jgi:hypothetical protein